MRVKRLLEHAMPKHYGVKPRGAASEAITQDRAFDLVDGIPPNIVPFRMGAASFTNNVTTLSVINYELYLNHYNGKRMSDGRRRCDFIITDTGGTELILLCEITSTLGDIGNLSKPIKDNKSGKVVFPNGKYEKGELQLCGTLENICAVPEIKIAVEARCRRICLLSYIIRRYPGAAYNARNAFNRPRCMEAKLAGENGAQISSPMLEAYGFSYYRISHDYAFKLF